MKSLAIAVITLSALTTGCASVSQPSAAIEDRSSVATTSSSPYVPAQDETAVSKVATSLGGMFGSLVAGVSKIGADLKHGFNEALASAESNTN